MLSLTDQGRWNNVEPTLPHFLMILPHNMKPKSTRFLEWGCQLQVYHIHGSQLLIPYTLGGTSSQTTSTFGKKLTQKNVCDICGCTAPSSLHCQPAAAATAWGTQGSPAIKPQGHNRRGLGSQAPDTGEHKHLVTNKSLTSSSAGHLNWDFHISTSSW